MNQSPDSSKPPVYLIADQNELQHDYIAVPTKGENLKDTKKFMSATHEVHGKLASVIDTVRGPEDSKFAKEPWKKSNRIALLEASTSSEGIQQSDDLYDALLEIGDDAPVTRLRIQKLLGYMNNYDPYINIRGVLERKEKLLERYAQGEQSSREERFAIIAVQAMDILQLQATLEFSQYGKENSLAKEGYKKANEIAKVFLSSTNSEEVFNEMGFSLGDEFEEYQRPEEHIADARTIGISGQPLEIAFITIHQVFENYFEEALTIMRKISSSDVDQVSIADLDDVTLLLRTANQYFTVLRNLLSRPKFGGMRESFGIASGAQSQQYHLMESYIGFPGDERNKEMRYKGITHLLGSRNVDAIKSEVPAEKTLKVRLSGEKRLHDALRRLNLGLLEFKAIHGETMLAYLDPGMAGSGGTEITKFFAKGMGAVFPVFTDGEIERLEVAKQAAEFDSAIHKSTSNPEGKMYADRFSSVLKFVKEAHKSTSKMQGESI